MLGIFFMVETLAVIIAVKICNVVNAYVFIYVMLNMKKSVYYKRTFVQNVILVWKRPYDAELSYQLKRFNLGFSIAHQRAQ